MKEIINKTDYEKEFNKLDNHLKKCDSYSIFKCITFNELLELTNLLEKLTDITDDISEKELKEYKCGDYIIKIAELYNRLFEKADYYSNILEPQKEE